MLRSIKSLPWPDQWFGSIWFSSQLVPSKFAVCISSVSIRIDSVSAHPLAQPTAYFGRSLPLRPISARCLFVIVYLYVNLCLYCICVIHIRDTQVKSPISGPANCLLWPLSAPGSNIQLVFVCICVFVFVFVYLCLKTNMKSPISGPAHCLLWPLGLTALAREERGGV